MSQKNTDCENVCGSSKDNLEFLVNHLSKIDDCVKQIRDKIVSGEKSNTKIQPSAYEINKVLNQFKNIAQEIRNDKNWDMESSPLHYARQMRFVASALQVSASQRGVVDIQYLLECANSRIQKLEEKNKELLDELNQSEDALVSVLRIKNKRGM